MPSFAEMPRLSKETFQVDVDGRRTDGRVHGRPDGQPQNTMLSNN